MLSAGDMKSCLRKLEALLRMIKYHKDVDYCGLSRGDPSAFLPIVSFALTSFSSLLAEQLVAAGLELTGKTDLRFTDTLYKILRDMFQYKPILSKQQFLQWGFSQRKVSVICDIINLVLERHNQLKKLSHRSVVVSHKRNSSTFPTNSSHNEALSSHDDVSTPHNEVHTTLSLENEIIEDRGGEKEEEEDVPQSSKVEERLTAMEAQLESLVCGLDRLTALETRLEKLENCTHKDKDEGQSITISKHCWDNLLSRVLLLETKLEMSSRQVSIAPQSLSPATSESSISRSDAPQDNLKDKLERITNMMKNTSSLLRNAEPLM
ncbi:centrosomal protein of 44 kDa [Myripristis murdjan]|uniref:centrosomal protein of 44 kDa n=1 Tax=Myripristis murdjan TaxID=586833 RepID=UPI00117631D5|nr:centrosomal protein of 44 kDa [Myripristis murdjan]